MEERDIIERLLGQDESGLHDLLRYYGPLMRYIIAPIVPDPHHREDCLSEAAMRVVWDVDDHPLNNGRIAATVVQTEAGQNVIRKTVYDVEELRVTGVAVELPGQREHWMIFHHFLWTVDPGFYGTESIQLWPAQHILDGWASAGALTGRVLYDKDGTTYTAPYYFLGQQTFTSDSIFWGEQTSTDLFAAFSMPGAGENQRGYVAYPVAELQDGYIMDSWFNYTHQRTALQYPAMTAMEFRMSGAWDGNSPFRTIQDALQFYPTEESAELLS